MRWKKKIANKVSKTKADAAGSGHDNRVTKSEGGKRKYEHKFSRYNEKLT